MAEKDVKLLSPFVVAVSGRKNVLKAQKLLALQNYILLKEKPKDDGGREGFWRTAECGAEKAPKYRKKKVYPCFLACVRSINMRFINLFFVSRNSQMQKKVVL